MDIFLIMITLAVPAMASLFIKLNYNKYVNIDSNKNISGQEVARLILDKNGLDKVHVVETSGHLSDHYDPTRKVVRLSRDIFQGTSIASIAIAAHECGHAIQDKEKYFPMRVRSAIFPIVKISTSLSYYIIMIGFALQIFGLCYIGIAFTACGLIFQLVTLPVEFNASSRAKKQLETLKVVDDDEASGVSSMLISAAFTYVAGVIASILQILRLILAVNNRRD